MKDIYIEMISHHIFCILCLSRSQDVKISSASWKEINMEKFQNQISVAWKVIWQSCVNISWDPDPDLLMISAQSHLFCINIQCGRSSLSQRWGADLRPQCSVNVQKTLKTLIKRSQELPEMFEIVLRPLWWAAGNEQPSPPLHRAAALGPEICSSPLGQTRPTTLYGMDLSCGRRYQLSSFLFFKEVE